MARGSQIDLSMVAELGLEEEVKKIHTSQATVQNLVNSMALNDVNEGKIVAQHMLATMGIIEQTFEKSATTW